MGSRPFWRLLGLVLAVLLVWTGRGHATMFDIPPGTWSCSEGPHRRFVLVIGDASSHSMEWRDEETGRDSRTLSVSGVYLVTATKGDYHTTFTVRDIRRQGFRAAEVGPDESISFFGVPLRRGDHVRTILAPQYDGTMQFDVFDKDISVVLTRVLTLKK